jgi:integrase
MASLRRKPNSKYWIACFTLPSGRRAQRSTKTTDRKTAQRLADDFEKVARDRMTEAQARRVVSDIHQSITGKELRYLTVSSFIRKWIDSKHGTLADSSISDYENTTKEFLLFLGERAEAEMVYLTKEDIVAFRNQQAKRLAVATVNLRLKILSSAFGDAWREGLIEENPVAKVSRLKAESSQSSRRAFTIDELKLILTHSSGEWTGLILFGVYTGQRLGDLARLEWSNIDLDEKVLSMTTKKTGRRQILPIASSLLKWLLKRHEENPESEYIFPDAQSKINAMGKIGSLSNQFYKILTRAGLVADRSHKKKEEGDGSPKRAVSTISFHSLRHTATSLMKNAGVNSAIVQEFVGHQSKAVSQSYTHIASEALEAAAKVLPDL